MTKLQNELVSGRYTQLTHIMFSFILTSGRNVFALYSLVYNRPSSYEDHYH